MNEEEFKLSSDDTMRRLRQIAQAPGELQWRLELLSTLERMRISNEIAQRGIMHTLARMRKESTHLSPIKLAELMNAQILQSRTTQESGRWRIAVKWFLSHAGTAIVTLLCAYLLYIFKLK